MKKIYWPVAIVALLSSPSAAETFGGNLMTAPSAQIDTPPSAEKVLLIRRFIEVAGIQSRLDSGSFLERYALSPELEWHNESADQTAESVLELLTGPIEALNATYANYRPIYQAEYEQHINWEFTEDELTKMIAFLDSDVGRHYLDGMWRMDAYTGTNLEEIEQKLVTEAIETYRSR